MQKKKQTFERVNKDGSTSEIKTATEGMPITEIETIEKIKSALNVKKTRKYYALFCIGINSALRIGDICPLKVSTVKTGYVSTHETKTGKVKKFPINNALKKVLNEYIKEFDLHDDDYLFFANRKDGRKDLKCIDKSQAYRKLKSIVESVAPDIDFKTHVMRKTCAYWLYKNTKDITLVMNALNHSSISVTMRYIGLTQESVDSAFDNLNL